MPPATAERTQFRIDIDYALCGPDGSRTPDTHSKTWFFEVPGHRDHEQSWTELLNRIFYDSNVRLRRREPNDQNWLGVVTFRSAPVNVQVMLASQGDSWDALPWFAAERDVVWEVSPCYIVTDDGRYDVMTAGDFTELILWRQLNAGTMDQTKFVSFFDHLLALSGKPPMGQKIYDGRATRLANLVAIRPAPYYQKPPGEKPWTSGPVDPRLIEAS